MARRYPKAKKSRKWEPISEREAAFYESEWLPPEPKAKRAKKKASKKSKAPARRASETPPRQARSTPASRVRDAMCRFLVYDEGTGKHREFAFTSSGYNQAFIHAQGAEDQVVISCEGKGAFTVLDCGGGECFPVGTAPSREIPTQYIPGMQGRRRRARRRRKKR